MGFAACAEEAFSSRLETCLRSWRSMLIRYGYEITVTCAQPTPMVCLLSVSEDRKADIRVAEKVFTTPIVPTATYVDTFGNRCLRLVAPPGDLTIWGDATIEDDGKIDPADFGAAEVPVAELPDSCLLFLMGSRYCETDKMRQIAWDLFGNVPPGWRRVQAVCDFVHRRIKGAIDPNGVRSLQRAD